MQPTLFDDEFDAGAAADPPDQAVRTHAENPAHDVVLEASAGTGKTRVLVNRYVRLIDAGVDPRNILAMTFTRKAAAEMRDRVLAELAQRQARGGSTGIVRALAERAGDIQISTIDAFCFGLLREFPLEADVSPTFEVADETEMARFANEALDLALRDARGVSSRDEAVRLLFTRVAQPVLREAVGSLLESRARALATVRAYVAGQSDALDAHAIAARFAASLGGWLARSPYRSALIDDGPVRLPQFVRLSADLADLDAIARDPARAQQVRWRLARHFFTEAGKPRQRLAKACAVGMFASADARRRHERAVAATAPELAVVFADLDRDVNGLLARGLLTVLTLAVRRYERLLDEHGLLDFAGMLTRAVDLLSRQEEFARSRLKLQSRYHHLLVDEFQDTSRLQWQLVERLIDAWGEGEGVADAPTSIFVVGDRKQSIYRFRQADVTLLDDAASKIGLLRPGRQIRQAISASFRAVPELLAFVNGLSGALARDTDLPDRFRFEASDHFTGVSVGPGARRDDEPVLGLVAARSMQASADCVASEIQRLLDARLIVRDRSGPPRPVRPDDIAILFRARAGHQYFEEALAARGIQTYVYKGLGFFDAPEVQDLQALLRYLARPDADLRAAEFLRSRLVRVSDVGLAALAPRLAEAITSGDFDPAAAGLSEQDARAMARLRRDVPRWLALARDLPPGEVVDTVLRESAYAFEMAGPRLDQARENVKKLRHLVRRVEGRGYATCGRLAAYFDSLRAGEESNAVLASVDAVNLMTIHAAKGLEFPVVFLVNIHSSARGRPPGFSVIADGPDGGPEVAFTSSPATKLEDERDAEELRRLLYVAVTRARDRLYLAAEVTDDGRLRRGGRSLASLLPDGLAALFEQAANDSDRKTVRWTTSGGTFDFKVCQSDGVEPPSIRPPEPRVGSVQVPRATLAPSTVSVTAAGTGAAPRGPGDLPPRERLTGSLVHRLFQRQADPDQPADELTRATTALVRESEQADVDDLSTVVVEATELYRTLRRRPDVAETLARGEVLYEVPFSYRPPDTPGRVVRGVIDAVVRAADGRWCVVEFKTGRPRPEHEAQVAVYAAALAAACDIVPEAVETKILYP